MYVCTSEEGYEGTYSHRHSELAMKGCRGAAAGGGWGFFALFLLHSALWAPVRSSVHEYVDGLFSNESNAFVFNGGSEGMLASTSFSHIRFESLTFRRPEAAARKYTDMQPRTQLIQAIIFEVEDRDKIGSKNDALPYALCCSKELADSDGCAPGEVIIRADQGGWPISIPIYFSANKVETTLQSAPIDIKKSGMYNLYFMFCDPQLYGTVVRGKTIWKNPTGYLPGRLAPLMKFYGLLSLAYLLLGLVWLFQYARFWKDIMQLQNYISLVIALGMFEMALWYFDYTNFNSTGYRPADITLWAVTFGVIRKTIARCLILIVSMGYGVVRPTLGGLTSRVLFLGATYFVAAEVLDVVEHVGSINDMPRKEKLLLVLPVATLDAIFIMWIFISLSKTLEKLLVRKLMAKLELYRKFTNTLAVIVVVSIAWIGYELFFKATYAFGERWQSEWIISAFWNMLSFILLSIVCWLWAPSKNATRYAYSEGPDDFDEEETIALTSMGASPPIDAEASRERGPVKTDVFRLEEEIGEEKIE